MSSTQDWSKIHTDHDLASFRRSDGYKDFISWIQRRCERVRGRSTRTGSEGCSEKIESIVDLLDDLTHLADETPALFDPQQRFGNKAFKTFIRKATGYLLDAPNTSTSISSGVNVAADADAGIEGAASGSTLRRRTSTFLSNCPEDTKRDVLTLWIEGNAFGHETRLDYGTGHELAFVLGLWVLVKRGWVGVGAGTAAAAGEEQGEGMGEEEEDELVLRVFPRYLTLTNTLQTKYKLEPAGSHGVWGLDDYVFLPYLFGSGQLLGAEDMNPTKALEMAKGKEEVNDMWTLALRRLFEFKRGPFFEHSPLLHNLSTSFPNFNKIHTGLFKMYLEEVLGKRVVVQHLPLPGWVWNRERE